MDYEGMNLEEASELVSTCDRCHRELGNYKCFRSKWDGEKHTITEIICSICDIRQYLEEYALDHRLNNKVIEHVQMRYYYRIENPWYIKELKEEYQELYIPALSPEEWKVRNAYTRLHWMAKRWEEKIWYPVLREYYDKSAMSTHSGTIGKIKISMMGCAGRIMFTMRDGQENQVTLLCHEGSEKSSMYVRSLDATAQQAKKILTYTTKHADLLEMNVDTSVGLF